MVCTFGDTVDIVWWRELELPTRSIIGRDGRLSRDTPAWLPDAGRAAWPELAGTTVAAARRKMVELLQADGSTVGEPRPVEHEVRYYEKGDRPLEIVTSRQWYIRNGARDEALRARLLEAGRELAWHPANMRIRFEHWVEGPQLRLADQPAALLRRALPGVVPGRARRRARPGPAHPGHRGLAARRSPDRRPAGLRGSPARRGRRVRGRSRRHGHLGHLVAHPPDHLPLGGRPRLLRPHLPHGPAASGSRDHPHVAVLHAAALAARGGRPALGPHQHQRLDPRSRPQEDVQVEGQHRHARPSWSPTTAPTACATGRAARPPAWTPRPTPAR